ncbi:LysR substrate-binding domain-containing protein [Pseudophaeobacter sp.]|uniref:LysR substrate-binding domain-containing protein n=1 Tax=Pseudophaeobacter sp. TaxID=1971739 RepID=UPI003298A9B7
MKKQILPLNAMRAYAAVHETGGIRSAARMLNVTHSSISRHLRFLEETLGIALLDRDQNQRKLLFTAQGEHLGQVSNEAMQLLSNAIVKIRETQAGNFVVISTAPSFASCWLMERIQKFNESFPWIEISIQINQKLTSLSEQGGDMSIRIGGGAWAENEFRILMNETLFPVCSPGYAEKLGDIHNPQCLKKAKLLHDRDHQTSWDVWRNKFTLDWFDPMPGPRFTSSDLVLDAASKGLGVALARGRMAEDKLRDGQLCRILRPLEVKIPGAYWILVDPEANKRKAVSTFVSWLHEECAKPGDWSQK